MRGAACTEYIIRHISLLWLGGTRMERQVPVYTPNDPVICIYVNTMYSTVGMIAYNIFFICRYFMHALKINIYPLRVQNVLYSYLRYLQVTYIANLHGSLHPTKTCSSFCTSYAPLLTATVTDPPNITLPITPITLISQPDKLIYIAPLD